MWWKHRIALLTITSSILALLQQVKVVESLKIRNVWTPDVIENGTQKSALIDCDFTYEERDLQSLELKWYFRHDPRPIYTWVPPALPQVDETFKNHINANYEISSDPYKKHRALHLKDISTKLSGRYSCRVSSIHTDEFKSKDLIIYSPPRRTTLAIGWVSPQLLNITCEAQSAYPEPVIRILINSQSSSSKATKNESLMDVSEEASRSVVWSGGSFSAAVSKSLPAMQVLMMHSEDRSQSTIGSNMRPYGVRSEAASVTCEFVLAKTPYREVRWQRIPLLPMEFRSTTIATNANCSNNSLNTMYILTFFCLIMYFYSMLNYL